MNFTDFKSAYARDGFVKVPGLLPDAVVDALRAAVDASLAQAAEGDPWFDFEPVADGSPSVVQRIKKPASHIPYCAELVAAPLILDRVCALAGEAIRLHHSKINIKAPHVGSPLEWHQDWAFVPHTNQDLVFTSIFIDDVPTEKGPMLMLPGSHREGLREHHEDGVFFGAIDPDSLDLSSAVELTGPRGTVCFHHPLTVHGSGRNVSREPRRILFFEYAAADAWPLTYGVDWEEFESRRLRGEPCLEPRLEAVRVKLPYPAPAGGSGKIYAQQQMYGKRYFKE